MGYFFKNFVNFSNKTELHTTQISQIVAAVNNTKAAYRVVFKKLKKNETSAISRVIFILKKPI